jgi:undecaprenyl-phosphate 4-deoxy-4-formamido-L-arabinose transferase
LLGKLTDEFDVVYGTPAKETHEGWRNSSSQMTKLALKTAMGVDMARDASAFRAFRTRLRSAFAQYDSPYVSIDVLLTWGTSKFTSVAVRHEPRTIGKSNYNFAKLSRHALNMITGYSTLPLTIASLLGFATMLFGILILGYILGRYLIVGSIVPGFYFISSLICIFAGCQLLCLGILGEYIARIHVRLLNRPVYTVRDGNTITSGDEK